MENVLRRAILNWSVECEGCWRSLRTLSFHISTEWIFVVRHHELLTIGSISISIFCSEEKCSLRLRFTPEWTCKSLIFSVNMPSRRRHDALHWDCAPSDSAAALSSIFWWYVNEIIFTSQFYFFLFERKSGVLYKSYDSVYGYAAKWHEEAYEIEMDIVV